MRIVQLTPGTGSFYCGTCLRDNALVTELRRQGHDAMLVPMYLPLTLDETPASKDEPVFYGGVNVYLQQVLPLFRKTPRWLDRLLDTQGILKYAGKRAAMTRADDLGDITLSMLRGEEGSQVKELDRLADWLADDGHADVVCLSNALLIGLARRIKERTGAAVACFLNGEHAFLDSLPEPERRAAWDTLAERAAELDAFLPVSQYYADLMTDRATSTDFPPASTLVHDGSGWVADVQPRPIAQRSYFHNGSGVGWAVPEGIDVAWAGEGEWKITLDVFRTRSSNARISSSLYVLSMLIIGTAWRTGFNSVCTSPPTRCVGDSGVAKSGCARSSSISSCISRSYSRSLIVGRSSR